MTRATKLKYLSTDLQSAPATLPVAPTPAAHPAPKTAAGVPSWHDLTPAEQNDLSLRYDGPIGAQVIADKIALRPVGIIATEMLVKTAHRAIADRTARITEAEQEAVALAEKKSALEVSNPASCMVDGLASQLNMKMLLIERLSGERAEFQAQVDALTVRS